MQSLYLTTCIVGTTIAGTGIPAGTQPGSTVMMIVFTYHLLLTLDCGSYAMTEERTLSMEEITSRGYEGNMSGFIRLRSGQQCVQMVTLARNDGDEAP